MAEEGRLKIAFDRLVSARLPLVDYAAAYPGTIVAQNGQTFDFDPDSDKLPGIQGIGIYCGAPGISFTIDPSQSPRAVLFFAGSSPAGAALGMWGFPGLVSLQIGSNASLAAARVTDKVEIALTDLLQFVFTAPSGGGPCVVTGGIVGTPATSIVTGSTITAIA
jgi:hypothetical protein